MDSRFRGNDGLDNLTKGIFWGIMRFMLSQTFLRLFPPLNALLCALAGVIGGGGGLISNNAFAQEATVIYGTTTPNVVSVTADNYIIYKSTVAATMTATIIAVTGTVAGGNFTPAATNATGQVFLTLRGLESCSIGGGCAAFGLENAADVNARLASLIAMDLRTVSMYAASGADLNEQIGGVNVQNFLLYYLASAGKAEHISVLAAAGANLNARDSSGLGLLHAAVILRDNSALTAFLAAGADANYQTTFGFTPLDYAIAVANETAQTAILAAGGRCNTQSGGVCP